MGGQRGVVSKRPGYNKKNSKQNTVLKGGKEEKEIELAAGGVGRRGTSHKSSHSGQGRRRQRHRKEGQTRKDVIERFNNGGPGKSHSALKCEMRPKEESRLGEGKLPETCGRTGHLGWVSEGNWKPFMVDGKKHPIVKGKR